METHLDFSVFQEGLGLGPKATIALGLAFIVGLFYIYQLGPTLC